MGRKMMANTPIAAGVSHGNDAVAEYTTHDNHDATDSNQIRYGHVRGYGRWYEDEGGYTLHADLEYLRCAGIEKLNVESTSDRSKHDTIPAKNQADLLYFAGHGNYATGKVFGTLSDPNDKLPPPGVNYSDINPSLHWSNDLNVAVFAACNILDIMDITGTSHDGACNWGRQWANYCLAGRTPGGPLSQLCGYYGKAPSDSGGIPQRVAQAFTARFTGSNACEAWGEANNAVVNTYWCTMSADRYYWHSRGVFGWYDSEDAY